MMRGGAGRPFDRVPLDRLGAAGRVRGHAVPPREADRVLRRVATASDRPPSRWRSSICRPSRQLDLEYRFPAYTGLAPRKADGGDVAAIRGTDVLLHVVPTMTAPRRQDSAERRQRDAADARRRTARSPAASPIEGQGFYRIELTGPHGENVDASPQYTIDVIDDQPPSVHFTKPGRDTQASPGRRTLPRGAGRRRLRREVAAAVLLGQRRRRRRR